MNTRPQLALATALAAALILSTAAGAVQAASSAASEVSGSVSTSVGALSNSVGKSSDSSTKGTKVAAGDYRVTEVAQADAAGRVRVKLQSTQDTSAEGELILTLPQNAAERGQLAPGVVVTAKTRAYGLEFVAAAAQQTFFLALHDDWFRELDSRPVVL